MDAKKIRRTSELKRMFPDFSGEVFEFGCQASVFSDREDVQSMTVIYIPHPYWTVTYLHPPVFDSTANTVASVAHLLGEIFFAGN